MVSTVNGIEVPLGPVEIGLVRFKFGIAAAASVAARGPLTIADGGTASTGHHRTTGRPTVGTERTLTLGAERRIAESITVGASTELAATRMDRLIANPSPRGFVSALIRGFNPRVQFGTDDTNLTVDVQAIPTSASSACAPTSSGRRWKAGRPRPPAQWRGPCSSAPVRSPCGSWRCARARG
jgi:hypothetical protein